MADYVSVLAPTTPNPGGTRLKISLAPINTFDTIPKEGGDSAATVSDIAVISTDYSFKSGGRFYTIEMEVNKNELSTEYQGAVRGNADKFTFTGFAPNLSAEQLGLIRKARNESLIVLVHLADDKVLALGEEFNGAFLTSTLQTGTQEGGERGIPITVTAYHYPKLYTGTVSETPAV